MNDYLEKIFIKNGRKIVFKRNAQMSDLKRLWKLLID